MAVNRDTWKFMAEALDLSLPYNQLYYEYLGSLGYTGTLQERIIKSGYGLTPNPNDLFDPDSLPDTPSA